MNTKTLRLRENKKTNAIHDMEKLVVDQLNALATKITDELLQEITGKTRAKTPKTDREKTRVEQETYKILLDTSKNMLTKNAVIIPTRKKQENTGNNAKNIENFRDLDSIIDHYGYYGYHGFAEEQRKYLHYLLRAVIGTHHQLLKINTNIEKFGETRNTPNNPHTSKAKTELPTQDKLVKLENTNSEITDTTTLSKTIEELPFLSDRAREKKTTRNGYQTVTEEKQVVFAHLTWNKWRCPTHYLPSTLILTNSLDHEQSVSYYEYNHSRRGTCRPSIFAQEIITRITETYTQTNNDTDIGNEKNHVTNDRGKKNKEQKAIFRKTLEEAMLNGEIIWNTNPHTSTVSSYEYDKILSDINETTIKWGRENMEHYIESNKRGSLLFNVLMDRIQNYKDENITEKVMKKQKKAIPILYPTDFNELFIILIMKGLYRLLEKKGKITLKPLLEMDEKELDKEIEVISKAITDVLNTVPNMQYIRSNKVSVRKNKPEKLSVSEKVVSEKEIKERIKFLLYRFLEREKNRAQIINKISRDVTAQKITNTIQHYLTEKTNDTKKHGQNIENGKQKKVKIEIGYKLPTIVTPKYTYNVFGIEDILRPENNIKYKRTSPEISPFYADGWLSTMTATYYVALQNNDEELFSGKNLRTKLITEQCTDIIELAEKTADYVKEKQKKPDLPEIKIRMIPFYAYYDDMITYMVSKNINKEEGIEPELFFKLWAYNKKPIINTMIKNTDGILDEETAKNVDYVIDETNKILKRVGNTLKMLDDAIDEQEKRNLTIEKMLHWEETKQMLRDVEDIINKNAGILVEVCENVIGKTLSPEDKETIGIPKTLPQGKTARKKHGKPISKEIDAKIESYVDKINKKIQHLSRDNPFVEIYEKMVDIEKQALLTDQTTDNIYERIIQTRLPLLSKAFAETVLFPARTKRSIERITEHLPSHYAGKKALEAETIMLTGRKRNEHKVKFVFAPLSSATREYVAGTLYEKQKGTKLLSRPLLTIPYYSDIKKQYDTEIMNASMIITSIITGNGKNEELAETISNATQKLDNTTKNKEPSTILVNTKNKKHKIKIYGSIKELRSLVDVSAEHLLGKQGEEIPTTTIQQLLSVLHSEKILEDISETMKIGDSFYALMTRYDEKTGKTQIYMENNQKEPCDALVVAGNASRNEQTRINATHDLLSISKMHESVKNDPASVYKMIRFLDNNELVNTEERMKKPLVPLETLGLMEKLLKMYYEQRKQIIREGLIGETTDKVLSALVTNVPVKKDGETHGIDVYTIEKLLEEIHGQKILEEMRGQKIIEETNGRKTIEEIYGKELMDEILESEYIWSLRNDRKIETDTNIYEKIKKIQEKTIAIQEVLPVILELNYEKRFLTHS